MEGMHYLAQLKDDVYVPRKPFIVGKFGIRPLQPRVGFNPYIIAWRVSKPFKKPAKPVAASYYYKELYEGMFAKW